MILQNIWRSIDGSSLINISPSNLFKSIFFVYKIYTEIGRMLLVRACIIG